MIVEEYLGDGVYATFDGHDIILDLRAQDDSRIVLDPHVMQNLIQFHKELL